MAKNKDKSTPDSVESLRIEWQKIEKDLRLPLPTMEDEPLPPEVAEKLRKELSPDMIKLLASL